MIIDFVIPAPQQSLMEAYHTWRGSPLSPNIHAALTLDSLITLTAEIRPRVVKRHVYTSGERPSSLARMNERHMDRSP